MPDVLILGYHAISEDWASDISVTPEAFERQLTYLVKRGYQGARFHEAATEPVAARTVVVTFDDAYSSVMELALPILDALGLPGTVFVPTRFADGGQLASWSGVDVYLDGPHAHELEVMSWEELGDLSAHGWEIGSHTRSHPYLTRLGDRELEEELVGSREDCERRLGLPCRSIAFPYGDTDARVVAKTGVSGYMAAAGLPRYQNLHRPAALNWPRVGVFYGESTRRFRLKVSPVHRRLRTLLSRSSYSSPQTSAV